MRIYSRKGIRGTIWYIDFRDHNGKRVRKAIGTKKQTQIKAADIESALFREKFEGLPAVEKDTKIEPFIERYFNYVSKINAPTTVREDRHRLKSFRAFLDLKSITRLNQITPALISQFQSEYLEGHSANSWNHVLVLVKAILNKAVEWEVIEKNSIRFLKKLPVESNPHYFTESQVRRLIKAAKEPMRTAIIILVYTGMRRSELHRLKWKDVDFRQKRIIIQRSKNRKMRSIPMSPALRAHLKDMRGRQDNYVCRPTDRLEFYSENFRRIIRRTRINGRLHDLRHTFASHLAIKGVQLRAIQELLGHQSIVTTQIYAHLSPSVLAESVKKLQF